MSKTTNFTSLHTEEGFIGDVIGNVTGDISGTSTGDVKTSSIQDLDGTEQIGVSASGVQVTADLTVGGNLNVLGAETILDVQRLEVEDYNIIIGRNNETSGVLNGSGITLHGGTGTDITFQYGSNGYMYLSNKLQVTEEVKTTNLTAENAVITEIEGHLTGNVTGDVTGQVSTLANHSTSNLAEGSNLYWTPARSDGRIALQVGDNLDLSYKNTAELAEGSNLYYTEARVDANIASKTTDNLAEGSNLYYTDARVQANRLDEMAIPTADLDLGGQKLTNLAEPVANDDAATKYFVLQKVAEKDSLSELSGTTDDLVEGTTNLFLTPNAQQINGAKTFNDAVIMSQSLIVPTPTSGTQAANKDYVDTAIASIDELSELLGTTDNIAEGSVNLYYTDARVHAAISAGTGVTYDGSGEFSIGQSVGTSDNVSFGQVYVRTGTGVGVDLNSQTNSASLRFHTSAGQTGIISTNSGNAPVQVYASLLWARAINGGTGDLMADGDVTVGGDLAVTGTISSPTITALEASISGDVTALQSELDATQTGAGLNADGTYTANASANYIASSSSLQDADNDLDTALKAEEASRQSADSTLQSNIDAEEAARIAADSTLQSNIDSEEAARIAGDASTLSSANSYTDTSIANLVDSAPATLDTLNELAAALADDPNFATTITNQVSGVQTNLDAEIATTDAEITALQAADVTLQSNIDSEAATRSSADTTLQSNIDTVAANLASEISATDAEVTALQAADVTLQSNIDTVAADLASEISTTNGEITALQAEVDAIESGAGLSASGAYVANSLANYISTASSLADADDKLDAAIKAEETSRTSADSTLQSNIDTVAADLASEISTTNSEISALQAQDTTLQNNIDTEEAARISGDASTLSSAQSYTDTAVANLVDSAPATLDTLNELAAALADDPNFATTVTNQIAAVQADVDQNEADADAAIALKADKDGAVMTGLTSMQSANITVPNNTTKPLVISNPYPNQYSIDLTTAAWGARFISNSTSASNTVLDVRNGNGQVFIVKTDGSIVASGTLEVTGGVTTDVTGTVSDISNHNTDALTEGSTNLYFTDARSRASISAGGDLSYNSTTGVVSFTERTDAEVNTLADARIALNTGANLDLSSKSTSDLSEGTNLYYTDARVGVYISSKTTDILSEGLSNLYFTDARARAAISAGGDLSYNSSTGVMSFTERTDAEVNTLADARIALQVGANLDLSSKDTDDLSEGSTNLYYTDARVASYLTANSYATESYVDTAVANVIDSAPAALDTLNELAAALGDDANFSATVTNSLATKLAIADFSATFDTNLASKTTADLTEGANLYFTNARARSAISVSGDLAYNSTTGVISFTERTDAEVNALADARIAAASVTDLSDVDQALATTDAVSFEKVTVNQSGTDYGMVINQNHANAGLFIDATQNGLVIDSASNAFGGIMFRAYNSASKGIDVTTEGKTIFSGDAIAQGTLQLSGTPTATSHAVPKSYVDAIGNDVDDLVTLSGVAAGSLNLGTFTGSTIQDNINVKQALQQIETALEANTSPANTDDLSEGSSNLYYTDERVDDRVGALVVGGTNITATYNDVAGTLTIDNDNASFQSLSGTANEVTISETSGAFTASLPATVHVTDRIRINTTSGSAALDVLGDSDLEGDVTITGVLSTKGENSQSFDNANNGTATNNVLLTKPVVFIDVAGTATGDVYLNLPVGHDGQELTIILDPSYSSIYNIQIENSGGSTHPTNMYGDASFGSYSRTLRVRYSQAEGLWMNVGGDVMMTY